MAPFSLLSPLPSFLRSPSLRPFPLRLRHSGPWRANGNQQLPGEWGGVSGWAVGGVRVKGGHSTGKVIAGAPMWGHRFPLQRLRGDVHTPFAPLLLFHPPSLTPLRPPLALLFLGSQGSILPRVNKVIPGVGQREAFSPPSSLLTPTSSKLWAPHFTPLNPAGTSSLRASPLEGVTVHVKV